MPAGVKASVWLLARCQCPGVLGISRGRAEPSTLLTGLEKVRYSVVAGPMCEPAAGSETITARCDGGNQLTCVAGPTDSHERGAAAISIAPVVPRRPSVTVD